MTLAVAPLPTKTATVTAGNPGTISGVTAPVPGAISYVGPNYGTQGASAPGRNLFSPALVPLGAVGAGTGTSNAFLTNALASLNNISPNNYGLPAPVYAPKLDFASVQAKSRAAAEGAVNPYYTKAINDFLSQQAAEKETFKKSQEFAHKALDTELDRVTQDNAINRERTTQDVATNEANIATKADEFQTDSGTAFDVARRAEAKALASSGLTGGLAGQQTETSNAEHNTKEGRQSAEFVKQKVAQEVFKARTFEDLAKSGERAVKDTATGKEKLDFDLNTYIQKQGFDLQQEQNDLELKRQDSLARNKADQQSILVRQFIDSISDPARRDAALKAYGGLL